VDICSLNKNASWRPNNKTEAMTDAMMGGSVVGTPGTLPPTQIGKNKYYY
jgi:hypothetical protein